MENAIKSNTNNLARLNRDLQLLERKLNNHTNNNFSTMSASTQILEGTNYQLKFDDSDHLSISPKIAANKFIYISPSDRGIHNLNYIKFGDGSNLTGITSDVSNKSETVAITAGGVNELVKDFESNIRNLSNKVDSVEVGLEIVKTDRKSVV